MQRKSLLRIVISQISLHLKLLLKCIACCCFFSLGMTSHASDISNLLPRTGLEVNDLALLVNLEDPQSIAVAEYYQKARNIPEKNIIRVRFPKAGKSIDSASFSKLKAEIDALTPSHIQAYAISWTEPYRVDCMSITSAITFGFNKEYCGGCKPTKSSAYFNSPSLFPFTDHQMRISMMLAGTSVENVKKLIDKGVQADATRPEGDAFLVDTGGGAYNVRAAGFDEAKEKMQPAFRTYYYKKGSKVEFKSNVMFYFTGTPSVTGLDKVKFIPGAMADHLTSFGGDLTEPTGQTKALRWLEAGASGSYGTVVEPCNYIQKFPMPIVAMFHYLTGETLIESYWKSVSWPGEGVFVGEPLSKPFSPSLKAMADDEYALTLYTPNDRILLLQKSDSIVGPFVPVGQYPLKPGLNSVQFKLHKAMIGNSIIQFRWQ